MILEVEEHHKQMGTFMKIGWTTMKVHNISNLYNIICNRNNNDNNKNKLQDYKSKEWEHKLL
jgi:hypothetical protein